jgi:hypothetical protein
MADPAAKQMNPPQAVGELPITSVAFFEAVPIPPAPQLGRMSASTTSITVNSKNPWTVETRRDKPGVVCCSIGDHHLEVPLANVKWIRRG